MNGRNYTSLLYGTGGPDNYKYTYENGTVFWEDPKYTERYEYAQQSAVLTDEVTHSGTDVLVYAKGWYSIIFYSLSFDNCAILGPQAHLFQTVHEQTYVAYVIAYAAQIGPYKSAAIRFTSCLQNIAYSSVIFYFCRNLF